MLKSLAASAGRATQKSITIQSCTKYLHLLILMICQEANDLNSVNIIAIGTKSLKLVAFELTMWEQAIGAGICDSANCSYMTVETLPTPPVAG